MGKKFWKGVLFGLLFVLPFWIGVYLTFGATQNIYLDNAGAGAGSEGDPYGAFAEINWTTGGANSIFDWVAGGDDVYINLAKGDTWRETLTVGASGASGHPVTIQAYGEGADPIINGADLVTGWTEHLVNVLTNGDFTDWTGALPNGWNQIGTPDVNNYTEESPADQCHLVSNGVYIGISQTALQGSTTYNYSITTTAATGTCKLALGRVADYIVISGVGTFTGSATTWTGNTVANIYRTAACNISIDELIISLPNQWKATLTTEPATVWFDGTQGTKQASVAACDAEFDWYWAANVLYVYCDADPDSEYTTIEATVRSSNIDGNDKSYITIDGIEVTKAENQGIHISSTNAVRATNWIVQNSTISNQDLYAIYIGDDDADILTPNDVSILSNTITDWYRSVQGAAAPGTITAPAIYQNSGDKSGGDNLLVQYNTITGDMVMGVSDNYRDAIKVFTGDNIIIEYNEIDQAEHGIHIYGARDGNAGTETYTIRYNYIHDVSDDFMWIVESNQTDSATHHNVCTNSGDNGFQLQSSTTSYGSFYNNVIDTTDNAALFIIFGCAYTNFKNNIIRNYGTDGADGQACAVFLSTGTTTYGTGSVFSNNVYYKSGDSTPFYETTLTARTLAQWQSDMSNEASSLNSDPKMTDPANGDFTLTAQSPCIDAGTPTDYPLALKPGSIWPDGVVTESQWMDGRFDIGAFRYLKYGGG